MSFKFGFYYQNVIGVIPSNVYTQMELLAIIFRLGYLSYDYVILLPFYLLFEIKLYQLYFLKGHRVLKKHSYITIPPYRFQWILVCVVVVVFV